MTSKHKTIGIVGGGQLGRMLTLAAHPLGFQTVVVDPAPSSPASQVGAKEITAPLYDESALRELARQSDFITIEIEHVNADILMALAESGVSINPAPATIRLIQDKYKQKQFLSENGVPVAPFAELSNEHDGRELLERFGGKMLVKTRLGAYDGRGNMVVDSPAKLAKALESFAGQPLYGEQFVPFSKELAVMAARDVLGNIATYPVVETVHERNICLEVVAPAPVPSEVSARANDIALKVAGLFEGAGMFGIEMFMLATGEILVNEVAPRVHNSGHCTMDSARTSQFEQHIRAVSGLPLGDTTLTAPAAVMVNILGEGDHPTEVKGLNEALAIPGVHVHLYGKSPTKIDRKMGHITATGDSVQQARQRAHAARKVLSI